MPLYSMLLLRTYSFRYYSPSTSIRLQSNEITLWNLEEKICILILQVLPKKGQAETVTCSYVSRATLHEMPFCASVQ